MKYLFFAVVLLLSLSVSAQSANADVQKELEKLFVAMGKGDSTSASVLFHPKARLMSVVNGKDGKLRLDDEPISEFMKQINAKKSDETYEERISNYEIKVDGEMATAWTPYEFYYNGKFSHCGVNAFQLVKLDGTWKILQITDTRRKICR